MDIKLAAYEKQIEQVFIFRNKNVYFNFRLSEQPVFYVTAKSIHGFFKNQLPVLNLQKYSQRFSCKEQISAQRYTYNIYIYKLNLETASGTFQ